MQTYLPMVWLGVFALGCQVPEGPDQQPGGNEDTTSPPSRDDGGAAGDVGGGEGPWSDGSPPGTGGAFLPPITWQEHWFDHVQLLKNVSQTEDTAIYFDDAVDRSSANWIQPLVTSLWKYTKQTYGPPGDGRLYAVFHGGRYQGEHDASIFDPTHDLRNVIDLGNSDKSSWMMPSRVAPIAYSAGDIVEKSPFGYDTLPSKNLTQNQFMYFFSYDALKAVGMDADADAWLSTLMTYSVDFPRAGTFWSRDWFYPLWLAYGGGAVYARFIRTVVDLYPKIPRPDGRGQTFALLMNWGEYVHFMSGAAGADLRAIATRAFGWPESSETTYQQAKRDFPSIKY